MKFAQRTFLIAGIYGLVITLPLYFIFDQFSRDYPPPVGQPIFYFGLLGLIVAWQVAFLIISRDPVRHRPLMIAAMLEKFIFAVTALALFSAGQLPSPSAVTATIDLLLGVLFVVAYLRTPVR